MDDDDVNDIHLGSFSRSLRVRNRSPRTIQSYCEAAKQLAAFHGDADLATMTKPNIETYLEDALNQHSASTAAVRFRSLQQLYKWMAAEDITPANPMTGMSPPSVPEAPVPVLPDDSIRALLKACGGKTFTAHRDTAIIRLFLEAGGPRLSELANLTLADIDLTHDVIHVVGKGDRARTIPFGGRTGQALDRYMRDRVKHEAARLPHAWLGLKGVPLTPSGITQILRRRGQQAGIGHLHPHMLRHTAAHTWLANGGSETDAMRLFGWRSRQMLSRYGASAADERARESARRLRLGDRF